MPDRVKGSGRISKKMDKNNLQKLKNLFENSHNISQRQAGKRFKCHHSYISKALRTHKNIRAYKKSKIPSRTDVQQKDAQTKCGRVYRKYKKLFCIIDDESYFTFSNTLLSENRQFYSSNLVNTPGDIKYRQVSKFEPKILVWICFSSRGISQPYFKQSQLAVNQEIYLNECIKRRLIPFIKKYHNDDDYVFWPDQLRPITLILQKDNPSNLPECRPIEDFWAILKAQVYKNNYKANSFDSLIDRIKMCLKNIDKKLVQPLANSTIKRQDQVRRKGVIENR
ncbi:hypothetical protein ABPG72_005915 [Tetrahymena utriculariae]